MELGPHQFEPSELDIQNFVQEIREKSNLPDILDASSLSSISQEDKYCLGVVRECMLQSWFQPVHGSVWVEHRVFERLRNLSLVPEQHSSVDSGVHIQWALSHSRS